MNDYTLPEPPLADFPTACSQMHDHDPADCAPEDIPVVRIPVRDLVALLVTIAYDQLDPDDEPELREVLGNLAAYPPSITGTLTLPAESAWRIAAHSYALGAFELDETAEATYRHPAVLAEIDVMNTVADDAPEVDARLEAERSALIDSLR